MMEEVTASVNETERRAITMQAIRDVDNLFDSWEKSGVSEVWDSNPAGVESHVVKDLASPNLMPHLSHLVVVC